MATLTCRVCGTTGHAGRFAAREMMYGTEELHRYARCEDCGCLQIESIPDDLGRYYPHDYYSRYEPPQHPMKRWLVTQRMRAAVTRKGLVGKALLARDLRAPTPQVAIRSLRPMRPSPEVRILDVGCGSGTLLRQLRALGYARTKGIDPFNEADITYPDGVTVERASLADETGPWDIVMIHHALEHVPDQRQALADARRVIAPDGWLLVRIPVLGWAWEHYGIDWVQLDPPRHLYLHSVESFTRLAQDVGFSVRSTVYDSTKFQMWGSELWRSGIPLRGADLTRFSSNTMKSYERVARNLNRCGAGDQAAFYLQTV